MKRIKTEESIGTDNVNAFGLVLGLGTAGAMEEWLRDKGEQTHVSIEVPKHNETKRVWITRYEVSEKHAEANFDINWAAVNRSTTSIGPRQLGQNQPEGADATSVDEITGAMLNNRRHRSSDANRWAFAMKPK
jgi:hypothetical protein